MILDERNNVQLLWVPVYNGIEGNEIVDQLSRRGSLHPLIEFVAGRVMKDWMCRKHQEYWQSIPGQRHTKSFLSKSSD
jgi:hypothetical protein